MYIRLKAPKPWSHLFRRKLLKWRYFDVHLSNRWCLMSGFFTFFLILCSSDLYPFTSPLHLHPYFLWRYYYFWQKGAIISLPRRGHSITTWTKFHPILTPSPHSSGQLWRFYILSKYSFSRDPPWTFTDPHSPFSCPRNFWMTPAGIKADISSVTHDMALQLLTFLNVVVVKLHDIFSIGVQH